LLAKRFLSFDPTFSGSAPHIPNAIRKNNIPEIIVLKRFEKESKIQLKKKRNNPLKRKKANANPNTKSTFCIKGEKFSPKK